MFSGVSSASQPLILVLLHFLAAWQSNEQSNPFSNLFLLLHSFEEVMTLEIASPGGMEGPDPAAHYTRACLSCSQQPAQSTACSQTRVQPQIQPCSLDESIKVTLLQAATR